MELDELKIVAEDLAYLKTWGKETNSELRRGSATLRRLLVENAYGQAWRAAGFEKQPKVIAVDIESHLSGLPMDNLHFALAAGANYTGLLVAASLAWRGIVNHMPMTMGPNLRIQGYPGDREYWLTEYLKSPAGFYEKEPFTRHEVIKFVANTQGGVHMSASEREKEKELVKKMSPISKAIIIYGIVGLNIEIAAIGQALGGSADAEKFCERVSEM